MQIFTTDDPDLFKQQALRWAAKHPYCACVDSGQFSGPPPSREAWVLGVGAQRSFALAPQDDLAKFDNWMVQGSWVFLALSYDLKSVSASIKTPRASSDWPLLWAFEPAVLVRVIDRQIEIIAADADTIFQAITRESMTPISAIVPEVEVLPTISFQTYCRVFDRIKEDISSGDYYEINFCQQFVADRLPDLSLADWYLALSRANQAPHGAFWKFGKHALLCCSPERFLARRGKQLYSQPIKGTAPRGSDTGADQKAADALQTSVKDIAEHVMIVDLVRHDLTQVAIPQTVNVSELQGVYPFAKVHQMISTVVCMARGNLTWKSLLEATFPMGSMTGAPKIMAMNRIDHYEKHPRGLYSGSVGYISPDGDFDLNVVIRSWLIDAENQRARVTTGGALVYDSTAAAEYGECLLKLSGLGAVLKSNLGDTQPE